MGNRIIYKGHSVGETIQATIMPTASVDHLGEIVQYVGPDTTTSPIYKKGKFYECRPYGTSNYRWLSVELIRGVGHAMYSEAWGSTDSKSDLIDTLNAFNDDFIEAMEDCDINNNVAFYSCYVDTPYEGMPTNTQIKAYYDSDAGWVYRGYSSSTADEFAIIPVGSPITDVSVVKLGSGDGTPHWSGTRAEYEAIKNTLEAGTYVSITDDYDEGLEVVDVVEEDNMNPVTSNAVAKITSHDLSTLTWNTTYVELGTWATGGILERCGIVQFTKIFTVKAGIPAGTIICSGLPRPAMAAEIPVAWDGNSAIGGFFFNTNGQLSSWAEIAADTNCRINLVYIKA